MNWKSNGEDDDDMVLSKSNVLLCVNGNLLLAGGSALPQEEEPTAIDEIDRQRWRRRPDQAMTGQRDLSIAETSLICCENSIS